MKNMALVVLLGLAGVRSAVSQQQEDPAIDGYVTRVASTSDFDVNGYRVLCGAGTQTTIGQFHSKEALSNQGCPQDRPYLGEPTKIFGSLKKKEHAVVADRIEAQPVIRGEITGSAVIDALPSQNSAGAKPGSLLVRADGYRIVIDGNTATTWYPPLNSLDGVEAGNWIEYKGRQRADGVVEAESARFSPNTVSKDEEKLRTKYEFDPAAVPASARQNTASVMLIGIQGKRLPPYKDDAMQARIEKIGNSLIPAYQRALPDTDPARINFRFQVVDAKWFRDALTLPSGIILVPRQVVERMQNDSQLAAVLADNIACALEKQEYLYLPKSEALTAAVLGTEVAGIFVPGLEAVGAVASVAGTTTGAGTGRDFFQTRAQEQSGRVSLGLLRDAGYDIDQAPVAWWLLSTNKPEPISRILLPQRAAYDYRAIGENWQNPNADASKP
jgi:hypothetical protein